MEDLSEALTTSINLSDLQDHVRCSPTSREDCLSAERLFGRTTVASTMSTYDSSMRKDPLRHAMPKTRDFQASFLRRNLWPKLSYADQYELQKDYGKLQQRYTEQVRVNETLKKELKKSASESKMGCGGCRREREKRVATDKALGEAVQLSYVLLQEVKRLDTELIRATSPKRTS